MRQSFYRRTELLREKKRFVPAASVGFTVFYYQVYYYESMLCPTEVALEAKTTNGTNPPSATSTDKTQVVVHDDLNRTIRISSRTLFTVRV